MLRKLLAIAIISYGCSPAKPTESGAAADTLVVQEYPVEVPVQDTTTEIKQDQVAIDTVFTETVVENNPATPQLDPTVAYIYDRRGLDLYEVNRDFKIEKVIGHLDYKAKVQLLNPLNKDMPLTVNGMKGYYALAQIDGGRMAYVFTGWLLNLPVPEEGSYVLDYFIKNVSIERALINRVDTSESGLNLKYLFEKGIRLTRRVGKEEQAITITLPGLTIQQGYILAHYFMPGLDIYLKKIPTDSVMIEVSPQVYYRAEQRNGKVFRISYTDNSGCYNFISFTETGDGVEIYYDVGC